MDISLPAGLSARPMEMSPQDGALVGQLVDREAAAHGEASLTDGAEVVTGFSNITGIDPARDTLIVESQGSGEPQPVAYVIVRTFKEEPGPRVLRHMVKVDPDWYRKGVGSALLDWSLARLDELATTLDDEEIVYRTTISYDAPGGLALMTQRDYQPVAYWADMERPLDDIPKASLPSGVELRPVDDSQMRAIWEADVEAFRDHWGFVEPTESDYTEFVEWRLNDPSLWTVAWHEDEIVGQIRSFINHEENERLGHNRGWTEFISTARAWRGKGIAGALIAESLRRLADRGLDTACLGVHTDNPNGALQLYEKFGYETRFTSTEFERPFAR